MQETDPAPEAAPAPAPEAAPAPETAPAPEAAPAPETAPAPAADIPEARTAEARTPDAGSRPVPRSRVGRGLFEPYALAVEMADRVSERRGAANKFFLSVQTTLLAAVGLADTTLDHVAWYSALTAALTGCAISVVWWLQLRSYRMLNAAKFRVINRLEERLPARIFTDEWEILKRVGDPGSRRLGYVELGTTERLIPWLLAGLHVLLLLGRLLG
ncbi:hypothetical protein ABH940_002540 [Streptacidiphilus sp. BW17]